MKNKITYDFETMEIKYGDTVIESWNDDALMDYPEDLCWRRDIGSLVHNIFKAGYEFGKKENDK